MLGLCLTTVFVCRRAEKQDTSLAERHVIDPAAGSPIDPQLAQTLAQRLAVAKIPGGKPVDSACNLCLRASISQLRKPIIEHIFPGTADVVANLHHGVHCNL